MKSVLYFEVDKEKYIGDPIKAEEFANAIKELSKYVQVHEITTDIAVLQQLVNVEYSIYQNVDGKYKKELDAYKVTVSKVEDALSALKK